jgi:hypothetical protein
MWTRRDKLGLAVLMLWVLSLYGVIVWHLGPRLGWW